MSLSLLIPTVPQRKTYLARLLAVLEPQLTDDVELLIGEDDGELTIGEKRNDLILAAYGTYIAFIDDDDMVAPDYVARILRALESEPDAVGFRSIRTVDGKRDTLTIYSHANAVIEQVNGVYMRPIMHLNPVKWDLARKVMFKPMSFGEDTDYAMRLRPLIRNAVFLDGDPLYFYEYRTNKRELVRKAK